MSIINRAYVESACGESQAKGVARALLDERDAALREIEEMRKWCCSACGLYVANDPRFNKAHPGMVPCPSTHQKGKYKCEKDADHLKRIGDVEHAGGGKTWLSI